MQLSSDPVKTALSGQDEEWQAYILAAQELASTGEMESAKIAMDRAFDVHTNAQKRPSEPSKPSKPTQARDTAKQVRTFRILSSAESKRYADRSEEKWLPFRVVAFMQAVASLIFFSIILIALVYGIVSTTIQWMTS